MPFVAIEHLGSTSVNGLKAKPVIDIFIALNDIDNADQWVKPLESLGYIYWAENPNKQHRRFFKGMPPYGLARTHHVHMMPMGKKFKQRVAFRDALRQNALYREQYEQLKCQLAFECPEDRERYTNAKRDFIDRILESEYGSLQSN